MAETKKTGILTFYHTTNYGALLQMYSLYHTLKKKGIQTEIIRYFCNAVEERENLSFRKAKTLKKLLRVLLLKIPNTRKQKNFKKFENENLSFSKQLYTTENLSELEKVYDKVIVGSDQIWNFRLTDNDMSFFLEGVSGIKKYAYAGSFGGETIDTETSQRIRKPLQDFDLIAVRENSAVDIVENVCGIKPYFVLDPTFLMTADEWETLAKSKTENTKPYVLLYLIQDKKKTIGYAKKIAEKNNWTVKYVNISPYHVGGVENIRSADPKEFLWLIQNSSLVITGSYHGLALSINMSRPVYYELSGKTKNYNARISSLITTLGMEKCRLDYEKTEIPEICYETIQEKLSVYRRQSLDVLDMMITK